MAFKVTPWDVEGDIDYEKLIKDFGISPIDGLPKEFMDNFLFRRGIVFAHRDIKYITDALKDGANDLEIDVANLWPNRLIGDEGNPMEERFTWTIQGHPYNKESKLLPSGLLGPVTIQKDQVNN